jgi:hypothetical protein
MTEKDLRDIICAQAKGWVGRKEADGTHRAIIDIYNTIQPLPRGYRMTYSDPWCAAFVSAVGKACDLTSIIYPECACDPMIELYKAHGRWMESDGYTPRPGDVIFYDWQDNGYGDNMGSSDHVGLVINVSGSIINIIEGNCSDAVMYTSRQINGRYIRGFGIPDYASVADGEDAPVVEEPDEPVIEEPVSSCYLIEVPLLTIGDRGGYVKAAQTLLIARGYDCGGRRFLDRENPDGEFGRATEKAVGAFQGENGLQKDGEIGGATWAALLKFD